LILKVLRCVNVNDLVVNHGSLMGFLRCDFPPTIFGDGWIA
jgi:hypothetical protein